MDRKGRELSIADVAGLGSALATFGLIQGALYLRGYWGHFGLDPFQFVAVSELALAGLAGICVVLAFMLLAAFLGDWLGGKITSISPERKVLRWLTPLVFLLTIIALLWWTNAWVLLAGGLLTIVCLVAIRLSPIVPAGIKQSPWLAIIVLMAVYFSIASSWYGDERALKIAEGDAKNIASVTMEGETLSGLTLIGRLGDTYALWDPAAKATVLLPSGDLKKLKISRRDATVLSTAP